MSVGHPGFTPCQNEPDHVPWKYGGSLQALAGPLHTAAAQGNTSPPSLAREPRGDCRGCLQRAALGRVGREGTHKAWKYVIHIPTCTTAPTRHVLGCPMKGTCRTFPSGTCMYTPGWETESSLAPRARRGKLNSQDVVNSSRNPLRGSLQPALPGRALQEK